MSEFKAGDIVRTIDYSYVMRLWGDGRLNTKTTSSIDSLAEPLEVIATGLNLPGDGRGGVPVHNDTIIKRHTDGAILFIQERFLRLISRPKRYKKVNVEVRPFSDRFTNKLDITTQMRGSSCNFCGPAQFIEVEIEDD